MDKYNVLYINWIQKRYGYRMIRLLGSSFDHANSPLVIFKVIKKKQVVELTSVAVICNRCLFTTTLTRTTIMRTLEFLVPGTEYEILKSFKLNAEPV